MKQKIKEIKERKRKMGKEKWRQCRKGNKEINKNFKKLLRKLSLL